MPESLRREVLSDDEQPEDDLADEHEPLGNFLASEMETSHSTLFNSHRAASDGCGIYSSDSDPYPIEKSIRTPDAACPRDHVVF